MGKSKKTSRKSDRGKARDCGDDLVQCPHLHFKTDVIDRNVLSKEQHLNLLSTPKGYRWEEYKDKKEAGDGEGPEDEKPASATRRVVCSGRRMKKNEKIYVHNFLAEVWTLLTPEMVDRLKGMLMNEFGMSPQEADQFIMEQRELNITNSSTVSLYKKPRILPDGTQVEDAVVKMRHPNKTYCDKFPKATIGIRNSWIKEYSDLLSEKISNYVLETMCADRTDRQQEIAKVLLGRFNSLLEQKASMANPKTRTHKTMVLVADRLSLWLDKNVKISKEMAERMKSLEEAEERKKKDEERRKAEEEQKKKDADEKKKQDDEERRDKEDEEAKKAAAEGEKRKQEELEGKGDEGADKKTLEAGEGDVGEGGEAEEGEEGVGRVAAGEGEEAEDEEGILTGEEGAEGAEGDAGREGEGDTGAESAAEGVEGEAEGAEGGAETEGEEEAGAESAAEGGADGAEGAKEGEEQATPVEPEEAGATPKEGEEGEGAEQGGEKPEEAGGAQEAPVDTPQGEDAAPIEAEGAKEGEGAAGEEEGEGEGEKAVGEGAGGEEGSDKPSDADEGKTPLESEGEEEVLTDEEKAQREGEVLPGDEGEARPGEESEARPGEEGEAKLGEEGEARPGEEGEARPGEEGEARPGEEGEAKLGEEGEEKEKAGEPEMTPERQAKVDAVIKSVASLIAESPVAPSSRQAALKDIMEKELEQELGDQDQAVIGEVASKVGTWIDSSVKKVEQEYGDRGRMPVGGITDRPSQTWASERGYAPVAQRPKGRIFKVRKRSSDLSDYDVTLISHTKAKQKIAEARGKTGFDFKVPDPEAALEPKDLKSWADWASRVSEMAKNWADWIEDTVKEAQMKGEDYKKKGSTKEVPTDWEEFKETKSHGVHRWTKTKKQVTEQAELWTQKSNRMRKENQTR